MLSRLFRRGPQAVSPRRRWRRHGLELIAVVAVFGLLQAWNSRGAVRGPAPALAGVGPGGEALSLTADPADPNSSAVTLVHFWATWCRICALMDGNIDAIAGQHRVLSVAVRSGSPAEVLAHLRAADLDLSTILDPQGQHAARWGVSGVPTTFFVDARGEVRDVTVGYSSWLGLRLRLWRASRAG